MTPNKRWIDGILNEAAKTTPQLPFERGARRAEMIARRTAAPAQERRRASA